MTRRKTHGVDGKPLEWMIQDSILDYLMIIGRQHPCKFWRARPAQYIRAQGSDVGFQLHPSEIGMPDIMGTGWGHTIGIEVKRPGGKLSKDQITWRDDFLRAPNTRYFVVDDLAQVIKLVENRINSA